MAQAPAPSGLLGPPPPTPPRRVPAGIADWNTSFALMWGAGYGGIPAAILCLMMALMGPPWHDYALDRRGLSAQAAPYAVGGSGVSVNDEPLMEIKLRFRDRTGAERQASVTTTNTRLLDKANKQEPIDIDYDPSDPTIARVHGQKRSLLNAEAAFVAPMLLIVFIIPGLASFVWGVVKLLRRRGIYRNGVAVPATVVEHTESASSENYKTVLVARYEFSTIHGTHSGSIKSVRPPPVGSRIWVIHKPDQPDLNVPALGCVRRKGNEASEGGLAFV